MRKEPLKAGNTSGDVWRCFTGYSLDVQSNDPILISCMVYIYILNIQTTAEKVSGPPSSIPKIYPNTKPQDIWMSRDINIGMPGDSK